VRGEGPLAGVRVVELAGLGPAPHAAMILADLGADVVRIDRPDAAAADAGDALLRGRRLVVLDLKRAEEVATLLDLVVRADVLVEGFRPGVAERLGVGPDECLARNPGLVYARVTGWGQDGPLAGSAGHDVNFIGLSGALHAMGDPDRPPVPPLNLVGDYGAGSMLVVVGVLAALLERESSGKGQVVDAAMVDGTALLSQSLLGLRDQGRWTDERGANLLDGSAPFYRTYACADGRYVAVGALEPQFFAALVEGLGLAGADLGPQYDTVGWPAMRATFAAAFTARSRDEWAEQFAALDACVTPVLSYGEAPAHPHLHARRTYVQDAAGTQAAPAPRFSRTPAERPRPPRAVAVDEVLAGWALPRG